MDIQYVCAQIGKLSGVPVRLFEEGKSTYSYALVQLPIDPMEACRQAVMSPDEQVGYIITAHNQYYGVVNSGANKVVLGPTSQMPLPRQTLHDIAFDIGVKNEDVEAFIGGMKRIANLSLNKMVEYLCLLNHILNGEKRTLLDVSIVDSAQTDIKETLAKEAADRTVDSVEGTEGALPHNTVDLERYMLELVHKGDVAGLNAFFASIPAVSGGVMAETDLRQVKNLLIVTTTLVSRAAMQGGMDAEEALTLSDSYIQKCEAAGDVEAVTNLNYRVVMDYAERMQRLHLGDNPSKLVAEVANYIRHHLSEPISVEKMAKDLCRGRSRLSTDFKRETGVNLSEYIAREKIEEGKKLLRYTNKPAVDIAFYLGFSSQSHFSRTFKQYVGVTPNEYRSERVQKLKVNHKR